ncbi:hypothetical protein PIB30_078494, partial [Stylosanthes scabra]|nr:hypothetical protein [Stylosanthes scabra]
ETSNRRTLLLDPALLLSATPGKVLQLSHLAPAVCAGSNTTGSARASPLRSAFSRSGRL